LSHKSAGPNSKYINYLTTNCGVRTKNCIKKYFDVLLLCLDLILLAVIISFLIYDLYKLILIIIYKLADYFLVNDIIGYNNFMCSLAGDTANAGGESINNGLNSNISTTQTSIIHDDGSWSNTIRSIFIYGSGALRLHLIRNAGTPSTRAFVLAGTIATDLGTKVLNNTINDSNYIKNHFTA
jgi:hypothetical protein